MVVVVSVVEWHYRLLGGSMCAGTLAAGDCPTYRQRLQQPLNGKPVGGRYSGGVSSVPYLGTYLPTLGTE